MAVATRESLALRHIGKGLRFPYAITSWGHSAISDLTPEGALQHVKESIFMLLGTRVGERRMLRSFGSRLHELLFEPNNMVLEGMTRTFVIEAIGRWEKRAEVTNVTTWRDVEQNILWIYIEFVLSGTNREGNLVFPFFLSGD